MGKPLSLADRIAQSKKENENKGDRDQEKNLINSLTAEDRMKTFKKSGSGQGQVNLTQGRPSVDTVSTLGQVKVPSRSGQGPVSSIGSRSGQGPVSNISIAEIVLAPQQQRVYVWFLTNGLTGYFNKGIISRETGINSPTVRKSITKIKSLSLIKIDEYDPVSRQQKYKLNADIKVNLLSGSDQGQVSIQGPVSGQGQVRVRSTSYKIDRKIIEDLSIYIQNSEFWKNQGLTEKLLETWLNEIDHCNYDYLYQQLQFAEATPQVQQADRPINYFYKSILKTGFTRPAGFEFPEEKRIRIQQEEMKRREDLIQQQEENRKKEKELADRESFLMFLDDKDAILSAVNEIEKKFTTPKMKTSIKLYRSKNKIDSHLEGRLKKIFFNF